MAFEILTLPALQDNYIYLIHDPATGATACVDVPDAAPVLAALDAKGWTLSEIWLTHHHWDHIDGVEALRTATGARLRGNLADAARLPALDLGFSAGESFAFAGASVEVLDAPGHTLGHVAFYVAKAGAAFTGDSLMAFGCGRLFEGTPADMWQSLMQIAALPPETLIHSGHEYSQSNARFALTIEPANPKLVARAAAVNAARAKSEPTVPVELSLELQTNPFLRAHLPEIKAAIGLAAASDVASFTEIRARKDRF